MNIIRIHNKSGNMIWVHAYNPLTGETEKTKVWSNGQIKTIYHPDEHPITIDSDGHKSIEFQVQKDTYSLAIDERLTWLCKHRLTVTERDY